MELSAEKKGMISDEGVGIEGSGALDQRVVLGLGSKRFGRRPLWKRIFFASKKVRGIILLNVLTVIYGMPSPSLQFCVSIYIEMDFRVSLYLLDFFVVN